MKKEDEVEAVAIGIKTNDISNLLNILKEAHYPTIQFNGDMDKMRNHADKIRIKKIEEALDIVIKYYNPGLW